MIGDARVSDHFFCSCITSQQEATPRSVRSSPRSKPRPPGRKPAKQPARQVRSSWETKGTVQKLPLQTRKPCERGVARIAWSLATRRFYTRDTPLSNLALGTTWEPTNNPRNHDWQCRRPGGSAKDPFVCRSIGTWHGQPQIWRDLVAETEEKTKGHRAPYLREPASK